MDSMLMWKTINTIILIALLYKFLKKPIGNMISQGISGVVEKFESAQKEKEEALKLLKEAERKAKEARAEAEEIIKHAEEVAEKQKAQMIAEAREMAERILSAADEEIERELLKAKKELQSYAAAQAVELAKEKIKGQVDEEFNKRIIKTSLSQIAKEGVL
ncbi:F0F1 ATP synthase subunit B [Desulfurobacterium sp.]